MPKKDTTLTIRLSKADKKSIQEDARKYNMTMTEIVKQNLIINPIK